mmetsp:Transcript_31365/g.74845  ORF Transcript_31365/g.74845 Transcript_31365/m.74845 type:complete len:95 (+) Transcript_31365:653-937(+)
MYTSAGALTFGPVGTASSGAAVVDWRRAAANDEGTPMDDAVPGEARPSRGEAAGRESVAARCRLPADATQREVRMRMDEDMADLCLVRQTLRHQ